MPNHLHLMGSDAAMDLGMMNGDVPIKNWTVGEDYRIILQSQRTHHAGKISDEGACLR